MNASRTTATTASAIRTQAQAGTPPEDPFFDVVVALAVVLGVSDVVSVSGFDLVRVCVDVFVDVVVDVFVEVVVEVEVFVEVVVEVSLDVGVVRVVNVLVGSVAVPLGSPAVFGVADVPSTCELRLEAALVASELTLETTLVTCEASLVADRETCDATLEADFSTCFAALDAALWTAAGESQALSPAAAVVIMRIAVNLMVLLRTEAFIPPLARVATGARLERYRYRRIDRCPLVPSLQRMRVLRSHCSHGLPL